jgi:hypothetical protein
VGRQAPYKTLAAQLANEGVESAYFDRLRAKVDPEQELRDLEREIAGEIASALGRTEQHLLLALAELDLWAARHQRAREQEAPAEQLAELARAFNQQREQAKRRLRDLEIHREAAGFRRNKQLHELYPIPARLLE